MILLAWEMSATVQWSAYSLVPPFLGSGVRIDFFQSCGHCWAFQICWHNECKTLLTSSFKDLNQIDYILWGWRWRSCIQSAKIRPGTDCGSDHQFLKAKFRLKLKKTGKNNRPARYDLNQIPYEFAVEVMNRFKGQDLVNSEPEELGTRGP